MPNQILLNDLLNLSSEEIKLYKVKFNQLNREGSNPMDEYKKDPDVIDNQWLFWRETQRYFKVGQFAVSLMRLSYDSWLLTTIKEVTEDLNIEHGINFKGVTVEKYSKYFGRVIVKYHKYHQGQGRFLSEIIDQLEVVQILPTTFDGDDFPGYDHVRLTYSQLETIIVRNKRDWIAALENQKAVYLITDTNSGNQYVGSATSNFGMLLSRWKNYVSNGHGGNKMLKEIVSELGFDYIKKYFQYSILENYNARTDDQLVLNRESWWKKTLGTRAFGLNSN
ncbi:endonuclease [Tenericutes bacterium MZ-XQ]|jgi:hypothetical protein|nr:endonuclease [Tenericutes bacterium MZ-XQ]